jgi:hypothetical protein
MSQISAIHDQIKPLSGASLEKLGSQGQAGAYKPKQAPEDGVNTFEDAHNALQGADSDVAVNHTGTWQRMSQDVGNRAQSFGTFFQNRGLDNVHGWQGQTGQEIREHAKKHVDALQGLVNAAGRMSIIVDAFSRDINVAKQFFTGPNWDLYQQTVLNGPAAAQEDVKHIFDMMAANFLKTSYRPPIDEIAGNHPDVTGFLPPAVGSQGAGPTAPASAGGVGGGSGLGIPRGGLGLPSPTDAAGSGAGPSAPPGGPSPGGAGNAAGDAAQKAASAAQNGAGQAGNAAQQAAGKALDAAKNGGNRPPEGVLSLGPKGSPSAAKSGSGVRGGGGAGARPALSRPAEARMAASSKAPSPAAPASRAGVSNAGSGGTGAPAAGQRRDEAAKVHKANKALHVQKHGEEVIGESEDAVVPVLGEKSAPANPDRP